MSMNNDYIVRKLVKQHQEDLLAEAAGRRLASQVPKDRRSGWFRLRTRLLAAAKRTQR